MTDTGTEKFQAWLRMSTKLAPEAIPGYADSVTALFASLVLRMPACLSISGAPGTGKSSLAKSLCFLMRETGITADWLSLDDYYLPLSKRQKLGQPLFVSRGVPGTHEVALLHGHIQSLLTRSPNDRVQTPVFDKAADDRIDGRSSRQCGLDCLIVEGWCLGCAPENAESLLLPVNEFENRKDLDGDWRAEVNRQLATHYSSLNQLFDCRWFIQVPDWQQVIDWRWQQAKSEQQGLADRAATELFLQPFQRLVLHMQATASNFDRVIPVDAHHRILL